MSYFVAKAVLSTGQTYELTGEEAHHISQVRRVKVGEQLNLQGTDGKRFIAQVRAIARQGLTVQLGAEITVPEEPILQVVLFQALTAEPALDDILQKSTELGAAEIFLFYSQHSPYRLGEKLAKKLARWQKILQESAKQCERAHPPELKFAANLGDALTRARELERVIILEPGGATSFQELGKIMPRLQSVGIFVGPEGGFTKSEVAQISALPQAIALGLGPRILRAPTASAGALALAQTLWGDLI